MTEKEVWDKANKSIFELYGNVPEPRSICQQRLLRCWS